MKLTCTAMLGWFLGCLIAGCTSLPQTTRMTAADMEFMATQMAGSLSQAPFLAGRSPDSSPMVIALQKVENLSDDVMTPAEQWFVMQRLVASLPMQALREQRNVHWVLPAERLALIKADPQWGAAAGELPDDFGRDRRPTHVMTAVFRSVPRIAANAMDRTDLYYTEFELMDLATSEPVWHDSFSYKRIARGHVWD